MQGVSVQSKLNISGSQGYKIAGGPVSSRLIAFSWQTRPVLTRMPSWRCFLVVLVGCPVAACKLYRCSPS